MHEPVREAPGESRASKPGSPIAPRGRPWAWGCLAILGAAFVVGAYLISQIQLGECLLPPDRIGESQSVTATLDAEHPIVEQAFVVHFNAAALPTDLPADAVSIAFEPRWDTDPVSTFGGPLIPTASADRVTGMPESPTEPVASAVRVSFIRAATNVVEGRLGSPESIRNGITVAPAGTISPRCDLGSACDRAYRVRVDLPHPLVGGQLTFSWRIIATVHYEKHYAGCGPPEGARVALDADPPVLTGADERLLAGAPVMSETGTVVARHVVVRIDGAAGGSTTERPLAAAARLDVRGWDLPVKGFRDAGYSLWARVVPDDSLVPVADGWVGRSAGWFVGGTIDFPVLTDCAAASPCSRGYWVIFQAVGGSGFRPDQPVPNIGRFEWRIEATAMADRAAQPSAQLAVTVDDPLDPIAEAPTVDIGDIPVQIDDIDVPRWVEVTFTLGDRAAAAGALDPLVASLAIVHVQEQGVAIATHLEGDGATTTVSGYVNGEGWATFIAHPFDRCDRGATCQARLRLVGEIVSRGLGSGFQRETARLTWTVSLLGAPPGTTIAVGNPTDAGGLFGLLRNLELPLAVTLVLLGIVVLLRGRRLDRW